MPRKPLSVWEKEQKYKFDMAVKGYCLNALKNIWDIANNSPDMRTRLQANSFLVEHAVGKKYSAFENATEHEAQKIQINLIPVEGTKIDCEYIDEICDETEQYT